MLSRQKSVASLSSFQRRNAGHLKRTRYSKCFDNASLRSTHLIGVTNDPARDTLPFTSKSALPDPHHDERICLAVIGRED